MSGDFEWLESDLSIISLRSDLDTDAVRLMIKQFPQVRIADAIG